MCTYYYRGQWVGYDEAPQDIPGKESEEEEVFVDTYSVVEEAMNEADQSNTTGGCYVELVIR